MVTRGLLRRWDVAVPAEWVASASSNRIYLDVDQEQVAHQPNYRPDDDVKRAVEQALWDDHGLRQADWATLRVDVHDGAVTLRGHVANRHHRARAEAAALRVRGVLSLRNKLVADDELEATIAEAFARHPLIRHQSIEVHVVAGIVRLEGAPALPETQSAVLEVAADVPGVRGIACRISGVDALMPLPAAVLPSIGTRVFASDGLLGHLERVVMNPRLRRVTHLVVALRPGAVAEREGLPPDASAKPRHVIVPMGLVDRWIDDADYDGGEDAVLLRVGRAQTGWLSDYSDEDYAAPAQDWQPPFDYRREDVCFVVAPEAS